MTGSHKREEQRNHYYREVTSLEPHAAGVVIFALRWKGAYRSQSLSAWLSSTPLRVIPVDCVDGFEWVEKFGASSRNLTKERLVSGRILGAGEIGASLTHREAYARAQEELGSRSWAVIVEDDLRVLPTSESDLLGLLRRPLTAPAIVNLQPAGSKVVMPGRHRARTPDEQNGALGIPGCRRVAHLPAYAQAYAINGAALRLALMAPAVPATPPDWPPWSCMCEAYVPTDDIFGGEEGSSVVDSDSQWAPQRRRDLNRRETWRYRTSRAVFLSWWGARDHYMTISNYVSREFGRPTRNLLTPDR